jgi:catechol 2,3-dioxygenase-like lactoylglutathione lyase family enzyme
MLDHVKLTVRDFEASRRFYEQALEPLGISVMMSMPGVPFAGFGAGRPFFWIAEGSPAGGSTHVAFHCEERAPVDAFHAAALAAGGTDNGGPGIRAHYHPNYYGAFVLDPDGHNIEAVCHAAA